LDAEQQRLQNQFSSALFIHDFSDLFGKGIALNVFSSRPSTIVRRFLSALHAPMNFSTPMIKSLVSDLAPISTNRGSVLVSK
jgi:hypothetical protein